MEDELIEVTYKKPKETTVRFTKTVRRRRAAAKFNEEEVLNEFIRWVEEQPQVGSKDDV